eukprot:4946116-Amphidinium_carterae.2
MSSYNGLPPAISGPYPGASSKRKARASNSGSRDYQPCRSQCELPSVPGRAWCPQRVAKSVRVLSAPVPVVNIPAKITLGTWRTSRRVVDTVASVQQRGSERASAMLLDWLSYLESNGEVAMIRELTVHDEEVKDLLHLTRIGTARKHLAMARRFRLYIDSLPQATRAMHPRIFAAPLVHSWLQHLRS